MSNSPMNVIYIMSDQQRADSYGPGRHPCADFPNLETLATESVNFSRCYAAAIPCVPSRMVVLSGQNDWHARVSGNGRFFMGHETTWMSELRDRGYRCVSVGKTHMVHAGSYHIQVPVGRSYGDQGGWDHFHPAPTPETDENYFDILATTRACDALRRLSNTQPFAMFVGFHAPHEPYVMPEKYLGFRKPEDVELPKARFEGEAETKAKRFRGLVRHFENMFGPMTEEMIRKGIAGHHCLMKMVDDCLGRLMDTLRELGALDNTLIVYTSDHGDNLGEHSLFNKAASYYEGEIRIPMLVRFPDGRHAGEWRDQMLSNIDWMPTLFDILKIDADVSLPGYSFLPIIEENRPVREQVTSTNCGGMMIRTDTQKLWTQPSDGDGEMYDLAADPMELRNLYNDPSHKEMRSELMEKMLHARITDDHRSNALTRAEARLYQEVRSSYEPET